MTRFHSLVAAAVASVLLIGCSDAADSPVGAEPGSSMAVLGEAGAADSRAPHSLPLKGRCETTFQFIPIDLVDGNVVRASVPFAGTCQITHLGRSEVSGEQTVVFKADGTSSSIALITFTSANGDQLLVTSTDENIPPPGPDATIRSAANGEITGGTGRFDEAKGTLTSDLVANLGTLAGSFAFEGTIVYDASERSSR